MAGEGRRAPPSPPLSHLLLTALALLSVPPGGGPFALPTHAGLYASPAESKSTESRVFEIGSSIRLEHPIRLRRPLQWRSEDENDEVKDGSVILEPAISSPQISSPPHHRRHQKSLTAVWSGLRVPQQNGPASELPASSESPSVPSPSPQPPSSSSSLSSPSSSSGPRRRLRAHEACYSSNEVLLVIGVTCAVNFAFILLVVSLVHLCNRGASKAVIVSSECEWLAPAAEELQRGVRGWPVDDDAGTGTADAYERVQEYVDSLPDPRGPASFAEDEEALVATAATASARQPSRHSPAPHGLRGACSMDDLLFLN